MLGKGFAGVEQLVGVAQVPAYPGQQVAGRRAGLGDREFVHGEFQGREGFVTDIASRDPPGQPCGRRHRSFGFGQRVGFDLDVTLRQVRLRTAGSGPGASKRRAAFVCLPRGLLFMPEAA